MNFLNKFLSKTSMEDGWKEKLRSREFDKSIYFFGLPTFFNDYGKFFEIVEDLSSKNLDGLYVGHFDFLQKKDFGVDLSLVDDLKTYENQKIHLKFYERLKFSEEYPEKGLDLSQVLSSMDDFYSRRVDKVLNTVFEDMDKKNLHDVGLIFDKKAYPYIFKKAEDKNIGLYHKRI